MTASLYVMETDGGHVKVGRSRYAPGRLLQVRAQKRCGVDLRYVSDPVEDPKLVELLACRLLKLTGKHLSGEWFTVTVAEAIDAIDRARRIAAGCEPAPDFSVLKRRTTLGESFSMRLDEDLKAALQKLADAENRSLTNFIETELRKIVVARKGRK